tara:strand:- start:66 stop:842 length:777 start_codon:yes stop_codon:yes gene_type:complete
MKQIKKIVQSIGNGGHVYIPREYIGKKVVIHLKETTKEDIKQDVIQKLSPYFSHIQGLYLCGSYARDEASVDSDIDILIITDGKIKIDLPQPYEIIQGSLQDIKNTIKENTGVLLPLIQEAVPIINNELLAELKKQQPTKHNSRWIIESTRTSLDLIQQWLEDKDDSNIAGLAYSLIMRLRGLKLLQALIERKQYTNKHLLDELKKHYLNNQLYNLYKEKKDNKALTHHNLNLQDIEKLHKYTKQILKTTEKQWEKLR